MGMLRWFFRGICKTNFIKGVVLGLFLIFAYQHTKLPAPHSGNENLKTRALVENNDIEKSALVEHMRNLNAFYSPSNQSVSDWKMVDGSNRGIFIYSAYYDIRLGSPTVRLITIIKKRYKVKQCKLWTKMGKEITTVAEVKTIRENWGMAYSAAFVICKGFKLEKDDLAIKVAIVPQENVQSYTALNIMDISRRNYEGQFAVCVKSFHYNYNRAVWLVEFVEFHRLLGVNKFFFYNHTVGPDVEKVLRYYIKEKIVEVYPWELPVKSQKEIRTEGIFAALNDCNLRNVGRYKYALMIDLDEFIIPRKANNYDDLIKSLGDKTTYVFQNVFFYLYWKNDTSASELLYGSHESLGKQLFGPESEGPYLLTAYKTTRVTTPHKHGTRSKYITKPEATIECGNHLVWDAVNGKNSLNVKPDEAIVHHYRICEFGGFDCLKNNHHIDTAAHKWLPDLIKGVAETCSNVFHPSGTCPKAPPLGSPW